MGGVRYSWLGSAAGNTMGLLAIDNVHAETIPEPVSLVFFGTGMAGVFGFVARRRIRKA
jgi:hypothetical protein